VRIVDEGGAAVLLVDGVIQSVSPCDAREWGSYWAAMVPPFPPRRALVLGLGGATLPHLILERWGAYGTSVVGVDDDPDVLQTAGEAGWLSLPRLEVVCADAFEFVRACQQRFDYVGVDLYRGPHLPAAALKGTFLRRLAALLEPPAWLAINLYAAGEQSSPRLAALNKFFDVVHAPRVGENLVLHCQPRLSVPAPAQPAGRRISA
jgi:spermidine synthase